MKNKQLSPNLICFLLLIFTVGILTPTGSSADDIRFSSGQSVYVSIYSHIYGGLKARPFDLASVLSIRNTDMNQQVTIISVKYYDTDGQIIKEYLNEPLQLNALASTRYIIKEGDKAGGSGANFIVQWKSNKKVNSPIIEAIMIGTRSGQGISFISRGQVIEERRE